MAGPEQCTPSLVPSRRRAIRGVIAVVTIATALCAAFVWLRRAPSSAPASPPPQPRSDAQQIRELLFQKATDGWLGEHAPPTLVVLTPDRQSFAGPGQHVVALRPAELAAYAAASHGGWVRLDLTDVTIAPDGRHATGAYGTYQGWTAGGARFAFEKRAGRWYMGKLVSAWVS